MILPNYWILAAILDATLLGGCSSRVSPPGVASNSGGTTGHDGEIEDTSIDVNSSEETWPEDPNDARASIDDSRHEETNPRDSDAIEVAPTPDHLLCEMACATVSGIPCSDRTPACVSFCEAQIARDTCSKELRILDACSVTAGPSGWICMEPLGTVRRPGVCQDEANAYRICRSGDGGT